MRWPWSRRAEPEASGTVLPLEPEALKAAMVAFLRGGGAVSLGEWLAMPPEMQTALEAAGVALRAELALDIAAASSGPDGVEGVAAKVDGGQASAEFAVRRAMDKAAGMVRRGGGGP